jgi:endo-1,4-beta-xylanase
VEPADHVKNFRRISNINKPTITVFLAPKEKANGVSVIVAPGGGHQCLVVEKEGTEIAEWLDREGISSFLLKYRWAQP